MAVVRIRRQRNDGPEAYNEVLDKLRPHENPPKGLIVHTHGHVGGGQWESIEIWESAEDADRYERESQAAVRQHLGANQTFPEPTSYEVHNIIRP
jgi:hypothetical protein